MSRLTIERELIELQPELWVRRKFEHGVPGRKAVDLRIRSGRRVHPTRRDGNRRCFGILHTMPSSFERTESFLLNSSRIEDDAVPEAQRSELRGCDEVVLHLSGEIAEVLLIMLCSTSSSTMFRTFSAAARHCSTCGCTTSVSEVELSTSGRLTVIVTCAASHLKGPRLG